ncbi:MAG: acetoin dehydrogenase [Chloroflexota bacterium]|nr:MAG: acetoin dehydrogenase [Chloroflexota bacterium]
MTPNCLAAVLEQLNAPLRLRDLARPALRPGQVVVEVAYSGVCGSQLLEVQGKRGPDRFLPHTLGHEGSGIVREVGPDVRKVAVGDRVVLSWIRGSGLDVPATVYQSQDGAVNSGALSTFIHQTVTCESRVTPVPADLPLREAALLGCAIPTGAGIILNSAQLQRGQTVAVFGAGGIGLSAIMAASAVGATQVIAIDIVADKLKLAELLGATTVIDAAVVDAPAAIAEATGGRGVDCAVESAGRRVTMEAALKSIRVGGICVLAGNLEAGEKIEIDPFDLIRGKRLVGTWGGESVPDRDIPRFVDMYRQGLLKLGDLITHEFPLSRVNDAIATVASGQAGRVMLRMTEE